MTKGLWFSTALTLILGMFFLSIDHTRADSLVVDQENSSGSTASLTVYNHPGIAQKYRPEVSSLAKVEVYLKGRVAGEWIDCIIKNHMHGTVGSFGHRMSGGDGWEYFTFDPAVSIEADKDYYIELDTDTTTVQWAYNSTDTYARGNTYYADGDRDGDFWFKTYYTSVSSDPSADEVTTTGNSATSSTSDGSAPAAKVSADIVKPSSLTATFSANEPGGRGVNLAWKASATADINGYIIFRSEQAKTGFTKIGETAKTGATFLDVNIAAAKTYYYQVRAFRGSDQSASSNTANITLPADIGPAKPVNFKITETTLDSITVSWDKNTEANLAGYVITLYKGDEQIATSDLAKDVTSHKFTGLINSTNYNVKLVAKDSAGKFSSPAWAFGLTAAPKLPAFVIDKWVGLLAGVGLALLVILIVMIIKRRRVIKKI